VLTRSDWPPSVYAIIEAARAAPHSTRSFQPTDVALPVRCVGFASVERTAVELATYGAPVAAYSSLPTRATSLALVRDTGRITGKILCAMGKDPLAQPEVIEAVRAEPSAER